MKEIIQVKDLKKSYGEVKAVQGISFFVEEGTLFAFLGPNGAGKSTTIDILCTLLQADEGLCIINGKELTKDERLIRQEIGVVFQNSILDNFLTARENIETRGSFYHLSKEELKKATLKAARAVDIVDILDRPYGKLSGGQRRRVDIARALVNEPKILFLDEPTTGLDPKTRNSVWNTILNLQKQSNMTVFLTTHYMEEAAKADYVVVIDEGKLIAKGTPAELREKYSHDSLRIQSKNIDKIIAYLNQKNLFFTQKGSLVEIILNKTLEAIDIINDFKDDIEIFEVVCGNMDEAFINIIGREFE